jgi:hypothetical protein
MEMMMMMKMNKTFLWKVWIHKRKSNIFFSKLEIFLRCCVSF